MIRIAEILAPRIPVNGNCICNILSELNNENKICGSYIDLNSSKLIKINKDITANRMAKISLFFFIIYVPVLGMN